MGLNKIILALGLLALGTVCVAASFELLPQPVRVQKALFALESHDDLRAELLAEKLAAGEGAQSSHAWLLLATAQQRLAKYEEAQQSWLQFLAVSTDPAERAYANAQLARCRVLSGPPPGRFGVDRSLSAERRTELGQVGEEVIESSEHFVVRAFNPELAQLVVQRAEIDLKRISRMVLAGADYPHSVSIYVWPRGADYARNAAGAVKGASGSFSVKLDQAGQIIRRIDLTQLDASGAFDAGVIDQVLPHEMSHLVLTEYFGDTRCPLVLNEGLAMLSEHGVDNGRVLLAGAALGGDRKISLSRMLMADKLGPDAPAFYAEAFSLLSFLHSRMTPGQFREMLAHVKTGCPMSDAIQRALYLPTDEAFLDRLADAWESAAIRQTQELQVLSGK